jgi:electron transfer flavoprotein beta subunit
VLGIQAAEKPPRYVPVSRVRQVTKTTAIDRQPAAEPEAVAGPVVGRMFQPVATGHAEMIEGDVDEIAARIAAILMGKW